MLNIRYTQTPEDTRREWTGEGNVHYARAARAALISKARTAGVEAHKFTVAGAVVAGVFIGVIGAALQLAGVL